MNHCFRLEEEAYRVTRESFDSLFPYWLDSRSPLKWDCLFVSPPWLKTWWEIFGAGQVPCLVGVRQGDDLIGIAPLQVQGGEARFIGDPDVCDYMDFPVTEGREEEFFWALIGQLRQYGIERLDLGPVRVDSTVMGGLPGGAEKRKCKVSCRREDVSYEMPLPGTWEDYLAGLAGTERHEIRRKLRRLQEAARVGFRPVEDLQGVRQAMDTFLRLFGSSRLDKSAFLTGQRARFFQSIAEAMARAGLLKLSFLELDAKPAAVAMCFDDRSTVYLYNNGYDNGLRSLSVGLLSKVLSIREAIREGRRKYDFLKGAEDYKRRLGGRPVPLYRCHVQIA